jgi:adenine-specific DNA-methyltransferase
VELIERFILSMTNEGDWVFDPFLGTGTSIIAAIRHNRRGAGAEVVPKYIKLAKDRIQEELAGTLRTRPMDKPVYDPVEAGNTLTAAPWANPKNSGQLLLIKERKVRYRTK